MATASVTFSLVGRISSPKMRKRGQLEVKASRDIWKTRLGEWKKVADLLSHSEK